MRHSAVVLALPLLALALAACGRSNLDRPDGSFDRAAFQELNARECAEGMRGVNARVSEAEANRLCGCIITRLTASSSDEELRAWHRAGEVPVARLRTATAQCQGMGPGGGPLTDAEEPPPPPEEPPPPPMGVPGDGPAPGGGAVVPNARPRANLSSYFTADDYPAAALRGNDQGRTSFRLDISPDGRVSGCQVTESSGSAALDAATCRIIRSRARYSPARDATGAAVPGRDAGSVTWRLPS